MSPNNIKIKNLLLNFSGKKLRLVSIAIPAISKINQGLDNLKVNQEPKNPIIQHIPKIANDRGSVSWLIPPWLIFKYHSSSLIEISYALSINKFASVNVPKKWIHNIVPVIIPMKNEIIQLGEIFDITIPKVVEEKIIIINPGVGTQVPSRKEYPVVTIRHNKIANVPHP